MLTRDGIFFKSLAWHEKQVHGSGILTCSKMFIIAFDP